MAAGHGATEWTLSEWYSLAHVAIIVGIGVYFGKKAIGAALVSRRNNVQKKLVETREQLAALKLEIEQARNKIKNIEQEKMSLVSKVEAEGRALSQKLVADAERTAERILADAKLAAQSEIDSSKGRLRQEIVDAAIGKTLETLSTDRKKEGDLSKKLHTQLVERFIKDASKVLHV